MVEIDPKFDSLSDYEKMKVCLERALKKMDDYGFACRINEEPRSRKHMLKAIKQDIDDALMHLEDSYLNTYPEEN